MGMPFTTQLYLSKGCNNFALWPSPRQAWPLMVMLFAMPEASRPHRQWPCGRLWLNAPHRLSGVQVLVRASCFVSDDSGVLTLGVSLPCLAHFQVFASVCFQALLVLFLRRVLCLGQVIRIVGCLPLAHHSQGSVALTLSDFERSSHGGGERVASTHHSCCIMRKCTVNYCDVWQLRTLPAALRLWVCLTRALQQRRSSCAHYKEQPAGQPGGKPGRRACRLHRRTSRICSGGLMPGATCLQYTVPRSAAVSLAKRGGDTCIRAPCRLWPLLLPAPAYESCEAASKQQAATNASEKRGGAGSHGPCQQRRLQHVRCCIMPFKRSHIRHGLPVHSSQECSGGAALLATMVASA